MNRFHKLENNRSDFPLLDNVNVYKYDNEFDYSRYNSVQMDLQICTVPWDVGEAHIGQRTISGIGNVVWFETKEARNAWFDAIPDDKCYRFSTKYKELHREMAIDVPIPFDMCARHNYLVVRYNLFANEHSPVEYEGVTGLREWFWFIREVEFIAPNNTRLHLLDDAFQTWMYDVNVSGMVLERGHAPMFSMLADEYLSNPLENNSYLLTEDVNYGEASQVKHIDALAMNGGEVYACIATTANPLADWGTKAHDDWHTPAAPSYTQNGVPSTFVFAMETADLNKFLYNVTADYPQFKQTVQGVFFASKDLIALVDEFTFAGVQCHTLASSRQTLNLSRLEKSQFGYEKEYQNIAKLYTYPYAHIEVTDEDGHTDVIKIEDTAGTIDVSAALSISYPFVTLDAHLLGVGGSPRTSVTFKNVTARTFDIQGRWYDTLKSWNIPTFAVVLDAAREYDYSTHFIRKQRVVDYTTEYNNTAAVAETNKADADSRAETNLENAKNINAANYNNAMAAAQTNRDNAKNLATAARDNAYDSADTVAQNTKNQATANRDNLYDTSDTNAANVKNLATSDRDNAYDSADTSASNAKTMAQAEKYNSDASADTLVSNTALQTAANTAITSRSNSSALSDSSLSNALSQALQAWEAGYTRNTANNEIEAKYASAAIGAAGGAINSAISGAASGAALGPVGAIAGAVGGLVSGAVGGATSMAQTAVAANLTSSQAETTVGFSQAKVTETSRNNNDRTGNQNSANSDNTATSNTASTGASANSAATQKNNATRTQTAANSAADASQSTARGNALRTKNATDAAADATNATDRGNADRTKAAVDAAADATKATDRGNALRTKTATDAAADATYATETANAQRTRTAADNAADNTYDTEMAANQRDYDTNMANAERTRQQRISAIENDILQAALRSPFVFGAFENGHSATNKPIALFANIVTQSKSAISSAGDEFLRYGYMFDKQWKFDGNWNVGKYFTYWKLKDFWVYALNVPDMYMDKLRFFLFGGVTVWRRPEDIGRVSIYENFS